MQRVVGETETEAQPQLIIADFRLDWRRTTPLGHGTISRSRHRQIGGGHFKIDPGRIGAGNPHHQLRTSASS